MIRGIFSWHSLKRLAGAPKSEEEEMRDKAWEMEMQALETWEGGRPGIWQRVRAWWKRNIW
jgi:hypothetical protein